MNTRHQLLITVLSLALLAMQPASAQSLVSASGQEVVGASGRLYAQYGDILVPRDEPKSHLVRGSGYWLGGRVYYEFDSAIIEESRRLFRDAAYDWSIFTRLDFIESSEATNRILVQYRNTGACGGSVVGRIGGVQDFFIVDPRVVQGCDMRAIMLHELGHALGAFHEHQRSDRDPFVRISSEPAGGATACGAGYGFNFAPVTNFQRLISGYDYFSVMHYPEDNLRYCQGATYNFRIEPISVQPIDPLVQSYVGEDASCVSVEACRNALGSVRISPRDRFGIVMLVGWKVELKSIGPGSAALVGTPSASPTGCGDGCYRVPVGATSPFTVLTSPEPGYFAHVTGFCHGSPTCSGEVDSHSEARVVFNRSFFHSGFE